MVNEFIFKNENAVKAFYFKIWVQTLVVSPQFMEWLNKASMARKHSLLQDCP